jgi:hypothetical protein
MEEWRDVPGISNLQASTGGRIRSIVWGRAKVVSVWPTAKGYLRVYLRREGRRRVFTVHRLICLTFIGPRPDGMQINHKNEVKADNRIENLEYVTPLANVRHSYKNLIANHVRGESCGLAKLTTEQVVEIRRTKANSSDHRQMAERFGVSLGTVQSVARGKTWKHVQEN